MPYIVNHHWFLYGVRSNGDDIRNAGAGIRVGPNVTDLLIQDNQIGFNNQGILIEGDGAVMCDN